MVVKVGLGRPWYIVVFVAALVFASCSFGSDNSESEPSEVVANSSAREEGTESDLGPLNQRILESVAPVSGDSMSSSRWLRDELLAVSLSDVSACLESRGRLDLLDMAERYLRFFEGGFFGGNGWDPFLYPESERLLEIGLEGEGESLPGEIMTGARSGEDTTDGGVIASCTRGITEGDTTISRISELRYAIGSDWVAIVENVSYDDAMMPYYSDFATCLQNEGVPDEVATGNPGDYILWAEGQRMGLSEAEELGIEQAQIYVDCGQEMFNARADLLEPERDVFVEEHRDQIQELTDLVVELGIE